MYNKIGKIVYYAGPSIQYVEKSRTAFKVVVFKIANDIYYNFKMAHGIKPKIQNRVLQYEIVHHNAKSRNRMSQ
jgi:hypothetical protein